ncbi:MAG: phosphoribosylanthranilate isomerase, partial [Anaerolineales bacterium]|nr:phosphoribosylanthranilate isomerase [Anaerolineales bacterium]
MMIVKICGIKTLKDAQAAINAGADYLGFNFYPKSVRFIEKSACAEITSVLKREHPHIKLIGVFVNSSVEEVNDILETCSLDLAQLHGDETPEMLAALNGKAFKAIRLSLSESVETSVHPFSSVETSVHPFLHPLTASVHPLAKQSVETSVHPFLHPLTASVHPLS